MVVISFKTVFLVPILSTIQHFRNLGDANEDPEGIAFMYYCMFGGLYASFPKAQPATKNINLL